MRTQNSHLDLGGAWQFRQAGKGSWDPATVPGCVHTDLMALGRIPDPHLGENEAVMGWVEEADWTYRRRFDVPAALLTARALRLVAEGLDTYATLWLNGRKLGQTQNMFVEQSFDLGGRLRAKGNELLIRFDSPSRRVAALVKKHGVLPAAGGDNRAYARKAQYSFGWDWGPRLPTSGVFAPIYIEALPEAALVDMHVVTQVATRALASGRIHAEVQAHKAGELTLRAELGPWSVEKAIRLKKGLNKVSLPWRIARPQLWWPHSHGTPHLYRASVGVEGGASLSRQVGLRIIELERKKDLTGESFGFKVNGVSVFAKGANWIPADSFLARVTPQRVNSLIQRAVEANMNMLRVWGGGVYESEAFYDACDREGVLVWQDFPFSCSEAPELPWFIAEVKAEAALALRRLRRHASLALWCGNNENQMARHDHWYRGRERARWGELFYETVLLELCAEHDPSTPYWPGSPYGGKDPNSQEQGDRHHWWVWGQSHDYHVYRKDFSRFMSEFGFAALPNKRTLEATFTQGQRQPQSRALQMHDKVEGGGALGRIAFYIFGNLPLATSLQAFRYLSQVNQALALSLGIEHWRRLKPHNQGVLIWQLNDCWPVTGWALLDCADTPKLAYHRVTRAFDDTLLSAVEEGVELSGDKVGKLPARAVDQSGPCQAWLTLDGARGMQGRLTVERWDMTGRRAKLAAHQFHVAPGRSQMLWERERKACGVRAPQREYLVFRAKFSDGTERRALLFFERPCRFEFPAHRLAVSSRAQDGRVVVRVRSKALAQSVELEAPVAGTFSDNGFDLLPGEQREVVFVPQKQGRIKGAFRAWHLGDMP